MVNVVLGLIILVGFYNIYWHWQFRGFHDDLITKKLSPSACKNPYEYIKAKIMCWRKSYRFWRSTQLSRLVDTYLETLVEQKGVKKITDLKEEEQILHEVYTHSPDMQMLLNLLTEK